MKMLRNLSNATVDTNYNGKRIRILPKGTLTIDDQNTGQGLSKFLLETYGFLRLEEVVIKHPVSEVRKALPKKIRS